MFQQELLEAERKMLELTPIEQDHGEPPIPFYEQDKAVQDSVYGGATREYIQLRLRAIEFESRMEMYARAVAPKRG